MQSCTVLLDRSYFKVSMTCFMLTLQHSKPRGMQWSFYYNKVSKLANQKQCACVYACMRACIRACTRACVCVSVCVCVIQRNLSVFYIEVYEIMIMCSLFNTCKPKHKIQNYAVTESNTSP